MTKGTRRIEADDELSINYGRVPAMSPEGHIASLRSQVATIEAGKGEGSLWVGEAGRVWALQSLRQQIADLEG